MNYFSNVKHKRMFLGNEYHLYWGSKINPRTKKPKKLTVVRLIKVTQKGYNLLNIETNKCVLKKHLYPSKYHNNDGQNMSFYINNYLYLEEIESPTYSIKTKPLQTHFEPLVIKREDGSTKTITPMFGEDGKLIIATKIDDPNNKQGYILCPYSIQVSSKSEPNPEYQEFMKKYHEEHQVCPKCGHISHTTGLMGYPLDMQKKDEYKDLNKCVCEFCGDKHIAHKRISIKQWKINQFCLKYPEMIANKEYGVDYEVLIKAGMSNAVLNCSKFVEVKYLGNIYFEAGITNKFVDFEKDYQQLLEFV